MKTEDDMTAVHWLISYMEDSRMAEKMSYPIQRISLTFTFFEDKVVPLFHWFPPKNPSLKHASTCVLSEECLQEFYRQGQRCYVEKTFITDVTSALGLYS